jgi:CheY-like chemotaxis protein
MRKASLRVLFVGVAPDVRAAVVRQAPTTFGDVLVEQVADAPALAESLARRRFDVALIASQADWADGLAILRQLKQQCPECPVVMIVEPDSAALATE